MFPQCSQNLDLRVGKVASCTIKLKLDVRHEQSDEFCPVSLDFFLNGARWYYPLARQMEFNSKLFKVGNQVDIMEELHGLTPDQIQALIEMVKKNKS